MVNGVAMKKCVGKKRKGFSLICTLVAMMKSQPLIPLMKNARKSPYFNAGMDRAKLT